MSPRATGRGVSGLPPFRASPLEHILLGVKSPHLACGHRPILWLSTSCQQSLPTEMAVSSLSRSSLQPLLFLYSTLPTPHLLLLL